MIPLLKKTSFDSSKCVSLLELTLKRIKILKSKKLIIAKQSRDDVAKLLQKGQDANAAARVEHVFREQNIAGAYDLLEQYCQLVIKRISAVKSQQECPSELKEAIASLLYAAPRCGDLQELQKLRDILTSKYGAAYSTAALELQPECSVNQQIIQKLSSRPPNSDTRLKLLKEIAAEYKINWNYQRAVAASFKDGETSMQDKQKVSSSRSQVSKGAVSTNVDNAKPPIPDQKEPANLAVHNAIPSKPKNADLPRANQASDVAQQPAVAAIPKPLFDSLQQDGGHKSHAPQNTRPSTTHNSSPNQREFASASKKPIVGSPTTVDKEKPGGRTGADTPLPPTAPPGVPVQQVSLKEKENLPAHGDAAPSAMHRAKSGQKDFMDASDTGLHTGANKQKLSSMYAHHDELKGQQSIANSSRNSDPVYEGKGFTSPSHMGLVDKSKPASIGTRQDGSMEKVNSVLPSTAGVSRPVAFVNPVQLPNVSVQKSSERRSDLVKPKGQASSTQDFYEVGPFSSKPRHHSVINQEIDGTAESLAAKQYMRAHESYVKADPGGGEDDHSRMEDLGFNMRTNRGSHTPQVGPYVRLRQEGKMDYKNISSSYEQVEESRRTPRAIDQEEDTSLYAYYDTEQPKGTHHGRGSNALSHESASLSREREWGRHQVEESSLNYHRNPSTLRELSKGYAARPSTHSELDHELADLEATMESAARAADAAKAAIDMVRTSSMRLKANKKVGDVKDSQREAYSRTSFNSSSRDVHTSTEGIVQGPDAIKDEHERRHYKHLSTRQEMSRVNTEVQVAPHQEQEPDLCDSEMPHFDDYSSYESSEEEPPFYAKGRAATARKDGGIATHHQGRSSAPYGYVDSSTAVRWGPSVPEGPTTDVSKQRWKLTASEEVNAQPPLQAHIRASQYDQSAIATQETGKHHGVSRRSVRSSRLT